MKIVLFGLSVLTVFLFTTLSEYNMTNSLPEYTPQLYQKGGFKKYTVFPWQEPPSVFLSLVVPAFNEENRLEKMMSATVEYFDSKKIDYEIIIVNDGSRDKTFDLIQRLIDGTYSNKKVFGVNYNKNGGKGFAVRTGMKFCRGQYVLMVDADGATQISEYEKLFGELKAIENSKGEGFAVGSRRAVAEEKKEVERKFHRKLMMLFNNFLVQTVIGIDYIQDTQCGFKLFTRKAAYQIFQNMHLNRWAFDVEMFYVAKGLDIPVKEVPVNWREIEGSKLSVVAASISFIRDYFSIIAFYNTGLWKIPVKP